MATEFVARQIRNFFQDNLIPQADRARLLFDTLRQLMPPATTSNHNDIHALCTSKLIPLLVDNAKYYAQAVRVVGQELDLIPQKQLIQDDLQNFMGVLRGSKRQAARAFLTAINNGATETQLCNALRNHAGTVSVDTNPGRHAVYKDSAARTAAIFREIAFRNDVLPADIFDVLLTLSVTNVVLRDTIGEVCRYQLNECLIAQLAPLPGAYTLLQRKYFMQHANFAAQMSVAVDDHDDLRELLRKTSRLHDASACPPPIEDVSYI